MDDLKTEDQAQPDKARWIINLKTQELRDAAARIGILRSVKATYQAELLSQAADALQAVLAAGDGDKELYDLSALRARSQRTHAVVMLQSAVTHALNLALKEEGVTVLGLSPGDAADLLLQGSDMFKDTNPTALRNACQEWLHTQADAAYAAAANSGRQPNF